MDDRFKPFDRSIPPVKVRGIIDCNLWHKVEVTPYLQILSPENNYISGTLVQDQVNRILDRKLKSRKNLPRDPVLLGMNSDPYPQLEEEWRLTRLALEIIAEHNYPLHIITASSLVLRDIDLICELREQVDAQVTIVMPGIYIKSLKAVQPGLPSPSERIDTLRRLKRTGLRTGIIFDRLYPGVNDGQKELDALFRKVSELNLDYIIFPHRIFHDAVYFFNEYGINILTYLPDLSEAKILTKEFMRYIKRVRDDIAALSVMYKVPIRIRRFLPEDYRKANYWLAECLADKGYYLKLMDRKSKEYFRIARIMNNLSDDIRNHLDSAEFRKLIRTDSEIIEEILDLVSGSREKASIQEILMNG